MTQINPVPTAAPGFAYDDSPQRSPEWQAIRAPRIGASELGDWMDTLKNGNPSQKRKDLEKRKAFEKTFGVKMEKFVTPAMLEGIEQEPFIRGEYERKMGVVVQRVGCFYNDHNVVSPDGLVGEDGGVEFKWLGDSSYMDVVMKQEVPYGYYLQCQDGMLATGRKWWDFVAGNANTQSFIVLRVYPDQEVIDKINESVKEVENITPLAKDNISEFYDAYQVVNPSSVNTEGIWDE